MKGAHEDLAPDELTDDLGISVPIPVGFAARRYPAGTDFPSGPEVGTRLPDFSLPNQDGRTIDFHSDRGDAKSVVVFFRSAVW